MQWVTTAWTNFSSILGHCCHGEAASSHSAQSVAAKDLRNCAGWHITVLVLYSGCHVGGVVMEVLMWR